MKIVITIPVELSVAVEDYARSKGVTRSEIYAQAVEQFLESETAKGYQRRFNEIYSGANTNRELQEKMNTDHPAGRLERIKRMIESANKRSPSETQLAIENALIKPLDSENSIASASSDEPADPMLTAAAIATFKRNEW